MIVTINGGSSSVKFAVFGREGALKRVVEGMIERIGVPGTHLRAVDANGRAIDDRGVEAGDHGRAAELLVDWLIEHVGREKIRAVGHRIVHGGTRLLCHQVVDDELIAELKKTQPLDLAHLPREIALVEGFGEHLPGVMQVACFDTAFHRDLPRVARLLPVPRSYDDAGVRRFGFHGLSYAYLMEELGRVAGKEAARGRVILAHLGAGASMAAVKDKRPVDTSMAFTPTAGLVMGTRPGDLDPGLLVYMMRVEKKTPGEMDEFISKRCGLIGVSQMSSDMRDLVARSQSDVRAREAVELFCYQAKKFIGAYAAALGGLDTLVFSAGIGEHSAFVRERICQNLEFVGIRLNPAANERGDAVISDQTSGVVVRVMKTDEEIIIARETARLVKEKS